MAKTAENAIAKLGELKQSADLKQTAATQNWKLIQGDLTKLLANEDSADVVIFTKIVDANQIPQLSAEGVSNASDNTKRDLSKEKKASSETNKIMPLQVILCRQATEQVDLSKPKRTMIPTGQKPVSFFMLFGDGTKRASAELYPGYMAISDDTLGNNFNFFFSYSGFYDMWNILGAQGTFVTTKYLGFCTQNMSLSRVEQLFDMLQDKKLIGDDDGQFFKSIAPHHQPSKTEILYNEQLEAAIQKNDFKKAVKIAKLLHKYSRQEAFKRCKNNTWTTMNGVTKLSLLDDCDTAYRLGEMLEPISKEDAIEALEILADYSLNNQNYDAFYTSPFVKLAVEKIRDIRMSMLGTADNEQENRDKRKEAIKSIFYGFGNPDPENQIECFRNLTKLFDAQCGNETMDASKSIFKPFDPKLFAIDPMAAPNVLLEMMLSMSDKIYELQNAGKTKSPLSTTDLKPHVAIEIQGKNESKDMADANPMGKPASSLFHSGSKPANKVSITFQMDAVKGTLTGAPKSTKNITSLDEEEIEVDELDSLVAEMMEGLPGQSSNTKEKSTQGR